MQLGFTPAGWDEYVALQREAPQVMGKVNVLIEECRRHPFTGTGRPEPLRNELSGWWSRRITREHRLVYRVTGSGNAQRLEIAQCRYHY